MSKKIAVIACLFPLLFSLMLSTFRPVNASAVSSISSSLYYGTDIRNFDPTSQVIPYVLSDSGFSSDYVVFWGWSDVSSNNDGLKINIYSFIFDLSQCSFEVSSEGIYNCSTNHYIVYSNNLNCNSSRYTPNFERAANYSAPSPNSISSFTYNSNTNIFRQDFNGGYTQFTAYYVDSDTNLFHPNALDVSVSFSPSLSGSVDLTSVPSVAIGEQVNTSVITDLYWNITNNSRSAIQYAINITSSEGIVWRYLSNDWCWAPDISSKFITTTSSLPSSPVAIRQYMGTRWHWICGSSDSLHNSDRVIVPWSNLPLEEGVSYTISVDVCTNSGGISVLPPSEGGLLCGVELGEISAVYTSTFIISNKGGITFTSEYNGYSNFIPYTDEESYYKALTTRSVAINTDGSYDYDDISLFDSDSSWFQKQSSEDLTSLFQNYSGDYYNGYTYNGGSGFSAATISGVSNYVGGYLSFLSSCLSLFPSQWLQIISLGLIALLVLGIIKAVIK